MNRRHGLGIASQESTCASRASSLDQDLQLKQPPELLEVNRLESQSTSPGSPGSSYADLTVLPSGRHGICELSDSELTGEIKTTKSSATLTPGQVESAEDFVQGPEGGDHEDTSPSWYSGGRTPSPCPSECEWRRFSRTLSSRSISEQSRALSRGITASPVSSPGWRRRRPTAIR